MAAKLKGVLAGVAGLYCLLCQLGYPEPELEYRFHPVRRWRWDLCWPELKVAVERQGSTYTRGRHTRGAEYARDCEKLIEGQLLGWLVIPYCVDHERSGAVVGWIERALRQRGWGDA